MNKILQRGFTLIELLVVIAIIGILAAVVIASLNDARSGGQDASLKQSMTSLRSQAELYYNSNSFNYGNMCANDKIEQLLNAVLANSPANLLVRDNAAVSTNATVLCKATETQWVVIAPLSRVTGETNPTFSFCVDFQGRATTTAVGSIESTAIACP